MKFTSLEISKIIKGRLVGNPDLEVNDIITDSRHVSIGAGNAFFAIRGKNHDGHKFISNLYNKGIRTFVVEEIPGNKDEFPEAVFIIADNTITALQLLAAHKRQSFTSPVIGITGSAGKTVVKEWLADKTDKIELVFLPPYAPESNPDEYLNRHFKTALRTGAVSHDKKTLLEKAIAFMRQLATMPERVKAYFRHPAAAYAAQGI